MASQRSDIIKELRTWIGTPWKHQGRQKGHGCDCVGLVEVAARMIGPVPDDLPRNYGRRPHGHQLKRTLDRHMDHVASLDEAKIGDVVLFAGKTEPLHVGVLTPWRHDGEGAPFGLIHAYAMLAGSQGVVTEAQYIPEMFHVVGYYRFRGVKG